MPGAGLGFASFNPHENPENTLIILILQRLLGWQSFPIIKKKGGGSRSSFNPYPHQGACLRANLSWTSLGTLTPQAFHPGPILQAVGCGSLGLSPGLTLLVVHPEAAP